MILYSLTAAAAIALAVKVKNRPARMPHQTTRQQAVNYVCLSGIFLILAGMASLRIDVGNDYGSYVLTFHEIFVNGYVVTEWGFNWLVRLLYHLSGGENYLLVFAVFAAATAFLFLKAMYDQSRDFGWSFALFMLLGLYFRTYNTVRYYFVLAVTLYSLRFVLRREYGKFLLCILAASLFHKSVLIVIPLYLIAALPWKKWQIVLAAAGCACLFLFQKFWMQVALMLYPSYQNTVYLEQGTGLQANAAVILRCLCVFALAFFVYRGQKEKLMGNAAHLFYLKLSALALALCLSASFLPLLSRITYYLITAQILLVPGMLSDLPEEGARKRWMQAAVIAFAVLNFVYFLRTADQVGVMVLPYRSWIFTEREWLNGSVIF